MRRVLAKIKPNKKRRNSLLNAKEKCSSNCAWEGNEVQQRKVIERRRGSNISFSFSNCGPVNKHGIQ